MDNFNIDFTLNFITNTDQKLIDEMNNITFEFNKLSREGDKLLQILNYYPKISKIDKFQIKNIPKIFIRIKSIRLFFVISKKKYK